jgi:hypothetical protein
MSYPEGFEAEIAETVKKHEKVKKKKEIKANKLDKKEWPKQQRAWVDHYNEQKQLPYYERMPYYQDPENNVVIMGISSRVQHNQDGTVRENPRVIGAGKKGEGNMLDFFVSGLLSDLKKDPKIVKEITIFDTDKDNSEFEVWYKRNGRWTIQKRMVRGVFKVAYRDMGDYDDKYGSPDWVYCKKKEVNKIEDLKHTTYERLFTLNLWETSPFYKLKPKGG